MSLLDSGLALRDKYLEAHGLDGRDFGLNYQYPPIPGTNWEWYKEHKFGTKGIYYRTGLFLIYLNPQGEPWLLDEVPYGVVRFLGEPRGVPEGEKAPKVLSQWGRRSEIHFEPMRDGTSWESLPHGSKVIHCESLVKAKAVHKATGYPCIGYNGVSGFSSAKQGLELIHQYTGFAFDKMENVILFDSDVHTNPLVQKARQSLSHKLRHIAHCDKVSWVDLPQKISADGSAPASNWGPDDYIMEFGADGIRRLIEAAVPYQDEEFSELVEAMNERLRWVGGQNMVYDRKRRALVKWADATLAFRNVNRVVPWGKVKRTVFGTDVWLASEHRQAVDNVGYRYMADEFFERGGETIANEYVPDGVSPGPVGEGLRAGSVVMDMLTRLFKSDDLELMRSYLKFLKFSVEKPTSYCVLWSNVRGVGKGWFTDLARVLLGRRHVSTTTADMLAEKYNLHTVNCRLLIAHEFQASTSANKKAALNYLKTFVGDEVIAVRAMHRNPYSAEARAGLIITVNDKSEMPSDGLGDRRQWYIEGGAGLRERGVDLWGPEDDNWNRVFRALGDEGEMAAVCRWLADGADIDFQSWKPPMTEDREEDLMLGQSVVVQIAHEVLVDARALGVRVMDAKAIRQLMLERMDGQEIYLVGKAFGAALKNAGWWTDKAYGRAIGGATAAWFPQPVVGPCWDTGTVLKCLREDAPKWVKGKY